MHSPGKVSGRCTTGLSKMWFVTVFGYDHLASLRLVLGMFALLVERILLTTKVLMHEFCNRPSITVLSVGDRCQNCAKDGSQF